MNIPRIVPLVRAKPPQMHSSGSTSCYEVLLLSHLNVNTQSLEMTVAIANEGLAELAE